MIRLAFTMIGGQRWTGGYNYLLNLVSLLSAHGATRVTPVLFFGNDVGDEEVKPFLQLTNAQVVRTALMNRSRKPISLARSIALGVDAPVKELFSKQRIDVVFESAHFFGSDLKIPTIAWIPDFQHRHLRDLFTFGAYWKRELGFRAQLAAGRQIMLSSAAAESDCHRFYSGARGKTHVLRFAAMAQPALRGDEARAIADQYELPRHYFYMPNQFWQHKNHALVIDALAIARERGFDIVVVASGKQEDPRRPKHVPELLARISRLGLHRQLRLLGLIPYDHVRALMVASQALLNPSRFEGWSTTVEEARALGVPMVLSEIPVHIEQAEGHAVFFDCQSPASLADALCSYQSIPDEARAKLAGNATAASEVRAKRFALDFIELAETCRRTYLGV